MALSKTLLECQEKIANTLMEHCKDMDPCLLENIVVGINIEVTRAYQLGYQEMLAELNKERSDRAWENDFRNGQYMGQ